jgi:hypothetical protein
MAMQPGAQPRSGGVTAVAVVNFVLGGLAILCGLLAFLGGAILSGAGSVSKEMEAEMRKKGVEVKSGDIQAAGNLVMIVSFVTIGWGVCAIIGGIGLIGRKQWGRMLTLILAGVAVILALFGLYQTVSVSAMNILNVLIYGGYAALVFIILLKPQVAQEFS